MFNHQKKLSVKNKSWLLILSICLVLGSCNSTKYIDFSNRLSKEEIQKDISYLKTALKNEHYDLNWQDRAEEILFELDQLALNTSELTVNEFRLKLQNIVNTIDDGTTKIYGFDRKDRREIKRRNIQKNFSCFTTDDQTVYLSVPNFADWSQLDNTLTRFKELAAQPEVKRMVIDLRNNHGGRADYLKHFLEKTIKRNTDYCFSLNMKKQKLLSGLMFNGALLIKGFKKSEDHLTKACGKLKSKNKLNLQNKYLLVDATTSGFGSMWAYYHLHNDGFQIVGQPPSSSLHLFANFLVRKLPNSRLSLNIAVARVILDQEDLNRADDLLSCDIKLEEPSMVEVMKAIKRYEQ